ncbi:hypothetical protein Scep_017602 [Stephania cephalantha]|uniref:Uncharacterized protein n=1 Tax=Stephania cephalantha TaxID=152367 RepID=A0AAP0IPW3_9MAGN
MTPKSDLLASDICLIHLIIFGFDFSVCQDCSDLHSIRLHRALVRIFEAGLNTHEYKKQKKIHSPYALALSKKKKKKKVLACDSLFVVKIAFLVHFLMGNNN